jgi:hypothetical protein
MSPFMTPTERENLINVKSKLAAKYIQKSKTSGSRSKRRQSDVKARSYGRQVEALQRGQGE